MPHYRKTFRLFVSSTFSDMQEERHALQKNVFPRLEELCREKGAKFQAVDLRWGVNEESQLNQKTMDICLNEISRCQKISPKPNFIVLLGERYGWQPLPYRIPEEEMIKILTVAGDDGKLLATWYRLDENAVPSKYILQPRGAEHNEYETWAPVEQLLLSALRSAVNKLSFSEKQRIKYFTSATHQEIMDGALQPPGKLEYHPREHVFAYLRKVTNPPENNTKYEKKWRDTDPNSQEMLRTLKDQLEGELKDHCSAYSAYWTDNKITPKSIDDFTNKVFTDLSAIISDQLREAISEDELVDEISNHRKVRQELVRHFTGRNDELDTISSYLCDTSKRKVLSLIGASGSGKSSVLAQAIAEAEQGGLPVTYRFIGTSSLSSNVVNMLQLLCQEIATSFGKTIESLLEDSDEQDMSELAGLQKIFSKCIALANRERPITLFLDALDQLSDLEADDRLNWLPQELPAHVKLIVSGLPELEVELSATEIHHLPGLPTQDAQILLERWLTAINRTITKKQQKEIIEKFACNGLPIYLKLAFERASTYHSYTPVEPLPDNVAGILDSWLTKLENEHTKILVNKIFLFMLCGKYQGLTEDEILDLLVFDEEYWQAFLKSCHPDHRSDVETARQMPIVVWSRLYLDLEPYLTERNAGGETIICFYHRQFNELIGNLLFFEDKRIFGHKILAEYFRNRGLFSEKKRLINPDIRKLVEQPFQQTKAGMLDEVKKTLCDLIFIHAKINANMLLELQSDFRMAIKEAEENISASHELDIFYHALMRDMHKLLIAPKHSFQIMYNGVWWETGVSSKKLDQYRERYLESGNFLLKQYRKPEIIKSSSILTLAGHTGMVNACTFSPDSKKIVSASVDNSIKLWDAETGTEIASLVGHTKQVNTCAFSQNGKRIVSSGNENTIKVWDVERGVEITSFKHADYILFCEFSPDGRKIVAGGGNSIGDDPGTLRLWDTETGQELTSLTGHDNPVEFCTFSSDGKRLISGSKKGVLRGLWELKLWDMDTGQEIDILNSFTAQLTPYAYSPDLKKMVSIVDDTKLKLWHLETGLEIATLSGHDDPVRACAFSPDGKKLFSCSHGNSAHESIINIWDSETGQKIVSFNKCSQYGNYTFSPDSKKIICERYVCEDDGEYNALQLWNIDTGNEITKLKDPGSIFSFAFSPDSKKFITSADDNTIKLWDSKTTRKIASYAIDTDIMGTGYHSIAGKGIFSCAFSPDGKKIISGSSNEIIKIWDTDTGDRISTIIEDSNVCVFSPDGKTIATGDDNNTLNLWNWKAGRKIKSFEGHTEYKYSTVESCAFSPDGKKIVSGHTDGSLNLRNSKTGAEIVHRTGWVNSIRNLLTRSRNKPSKNTTAFIGHTGNICACAFSPDGEKIVSGDENGTLKMWDSITGQEIESFIGHNDYVNDCAFSPDGKRIVSVGGHDDRLKLWDTGTGLEITTPMHTDYMSFCVFFPDGTKILTGGGSPGSNSNTLKLWDSETGAEIVGFRFYTDYLLRSCDISPCGKIIACGDDDGNFYLLKIEGLEK